MQPVPFTIRDSAPTDIAVGADPVLHHDGLPETLAEFIRKNAPDDVGAAARRR